MNRQGKVWGYTSLLVNKNNVEVHLVFIQKGGYCSKHCHKHKYNQFIVTSGRLKVTQWKGYGLADETILESGMECTVSPNEFHQFEALEDTHALEVYWVDLDQDDIIREGCGGVKNEKAPNLCHEIASRGSRQAIFIDQANPHNPASER